MFALLAQIDTEVTAHAAVYPHAPRPSADLYISLLAAMRSLAGVPALAAVRAGPLVGAGQPAAPAAAMPTQHTCTLPPLSDPQMLDDEEAPHKGPSTVHACLEVLLAQASNRV